VQKQIQSIDLTAKLQELYVPDQGFTGFANFEARCLRGIKQTIVNTDKGLIPVRKLEKIGSGGDRCIVCYAPFSINEWGRDVGSFAEHIQSNVAALEATGFNGYFYYQIGGFPSPSGKEIQYAAVPNSGKIFMMLEACKRGFKKVLWMDSALIPLRNPAAFFIWIETRGYFFRGETTPTNAWSYIFPTTRQQLKDLTGTDVLNSCFINTHIFGLKMDTPLAQKLIEDYYQLVDLGTPFLSCFPDEFVLTSILGQPEFSSWQPFNLVTFLQSFDRVPQSPENLQKLKDERYFFYQRAQ
jgi:hypothetical protein